MAEDIEDAVEKALSEAPERSFVESVDIAVNLRDLNLNEPDNRIDEEIVLPSGTGKEIMVAVIADGETAVRAEDVADRVLRPDDISDLGDNEGEAKDLAEEIDFFIGEKEYMQDVARHLGSILGPRGKMPNPLGEDDDVVRVVQRLKGTISLRSRDRRTFHAMVGTEEMESDELADNIDAIVRRLTATLEKGPLNIDSIYVKTTMGPSVEVPV